MWTKQVSILAIALLAMSNVGFAQPYQHRRHEQYHKRDRVAVSVQQEVGQPAQINDNSLKISGKAGIVYSPYADQGGCKSKDKQKEELGKLGGYGLIRVYGVDCHQIENALDFHKGKVFLGIYDVDKMNDGLEKMITQVKKRWNRVHTVAIGNEHVHNGKKNADQMVAFLNAARPKLKSAGYQGPCVIVDTFVKINEHPKLCQASDYVAANMHPFFDQHTQPGGSATFIDTQVANTKRKCNNKPVIVTETGWPKDGQALFGKKPTLEAHRTAIKSILDAKQGSQTIFLTAFDEKWKKDFSGSAGAETHWGLNPL